MNARAPLAFRLLCTVALGGGVMIVVLQRDAIAKARVEHQNLLKESDEVERLTRENAGLAELRATNEEVKRLRQRLRELARLRNEVVQWRAQAAEATTIRAENQRLASLQSGAASGETNAMPANFISRAQMADVGLGSPEAAAQTYLYAGFQGDFRRMLQCQGQQSDLTPEQEEHQSQYLQRDFANFPGFFIADKNVISPDEEQIDVQATVGGVVFPIHLIRNGNEWNVRQ
jgi:hypothetical protein